MAIRLSNSGKRKLTKPSGMDLERLLDVALDGILVVDASSTIVLFSEGAARIFGYRREEIVGAPLSTLLPSRVRSHHAEVQREFEQSGVSRRMKADRQSVSGLRRDGTEVQLDISLARYPAPSKLTLAVIRDVSDRANAQRDLERSESMRLTLAEHSPLCVKTVTRDGKIVDINPAGLAMLGVSSRGDLQGKTLSAFVHPQDRPALAQAIDGVADGVASHVAFRMLDADGTVHWMESTLAQFGEESNDSDLILSVTRDVTEARLSQRRLLASEARFRHLAALAADTFWEQDDQLRYTYSSNSAGEKTGALPIALLGKQRWDIVADVASDTDWALHRDLLAARKPFRDFVYPQQLTPDRIRWVSSSGDPQFDESGRFIGYRGVARDITEYRRQQEALIRYGHFDELTGLANRHLLADRLGRAIARGRRSGSVTAVMLIDLDGFKQVNDSLGHHCGDVVLRAIADRLGRAVRTGDTVARLGGDEFVVVAEGLVEADAVAGLASKLLREIEIPVAIDDQEVSFSASIGICVHPRDGAEPATLLRNADSAMYEAKAAGRNRFSFYTAEMNERAVRHLKLQGLLRRALQEQQFTLAYQPIVDGATGRWTYAEALLRWTTPEGESVSPVEFIPVAEASGLIIPLGDWVLHTVCAQLHAWRAAGVPMIPIAVNLSAKQFFQDDLVDQIGRHLRQAGNLDPKLLHLEVTESVAMREPKRSAKQLGELTKLGVSISIDDFGTGHSSLAYLRDFPVQDVKIDRSFLVGVPGNKNSEVIVSAVISLAHALELRVVAEGVEHIEQREWLQAQGCDMLQGYLFSKPMPVEAFSAMLAQPE